MRAALLAAAILALPGAASADDWDARVSARLALGGGAYIAEQGLDPWPHFEVALRSDLLFGEARPAQVRFGPAIDLRTEGFRTLELAGGLALLLPLDSGFALTVTAGAGWGARPEGRDGALALGQLAVGWRPYNYFSAYSWAINFYAGARAQLMEPRVWEVTAGIEIDLEILFVIPVMFVVELARAGDPDEPLEEPE